ncbi:hypothetical protein [Spirochaeta lutea]|uniref:Uncharacterized protein n=1 Tax=Spirochaeta lutea TaxID=1480694 RepID=A0A098QZ53_9SPIO|nr:hypothetical protein [Spirochaeta lutea]KGE72796.1 hypothetical protein DC28_06080 [Spirochaeta lutea]
MQTLNLTVYCTPQSRHQLVVDLEGVTRALPGSVRNRLRIEFRLCKKAEAGCPKITLNNRPLENPTIDGIIDALHQGVFSAA